MCLCVVCIVVLLFKEKHVHVVLWFQQLHKPAVGILTLCSEDPRRFNTYTRASRFVAVIWCIRVRWFQVSGFEVGLSLQDGNTGLNHLWAQVAGARGDRVWGAVLRQAQ